jgi:ribosomal protein S18 acetylase RimI-like enzyme
MEDAGKAVRSRLRIRPFESDDEEAVVELWKSCGLVRPSNDPYQDIRRKLAVRPDLFLVGLLEDQVVATVMAGYEGHRGWLNYVAVDPRLQRRGLAREIVEAAELALRRSGCPKVNLQVRSTNTSALEFYRRIGYVPDDVVSLGKRLVHDASPGARSREAER